MTTPTITEIIEGSLLSERTADVSDQASRVEEEAAMHRAIEHTRKMRRSQEPDTEGVYAITDCDDCGGEIGHDRIAVAIQNTLCWGCATIREKRRGFQRG